MLEGSPYLYSQACTSNLNRQGVTRGAKVVGWKAFEDSGRICDSCLYIDLTSFGVASGHLGLDCVRDVEAGSQKALQ
jgi:hypothetical protein